VPRLDGVPRYRPLTAIAAPPGGAAAMLSQSKDTTMSEQTDHIRRLNDMTRTQPQIVNAAWVLTQGVSHLLVGDLAPGQPVATHAPERLVALRAALASFRDWESGNDPYGEHDFGAFALFGARLFFKIVYYHPDHDTLAPVPGNIELCRRVLTVMLADEY
jgi:hypothetical protein